MIDCAPALKPSPEVRESLEVALLLDALYWRSGKDLRRHPAAPVHAAIAATRDVLGLPMITALLDGVVHDDAVLQRLLRMLANVAPLPDAAAAFCGQWEKILLPLLRSTPFPGLWVADCLDARILQQLVLLLTEAQLLERARLFVTASDPALLRRLKDAVDESLIAALRPHPAIIWSDYVLQTDATFNEFDFIFCGHTLRQSPLEDQRRIVRLLRDSLAPCGLLQLACFEPSDAATLAPTFLPLTPTLDLYRHATLQRQAQQRSEL